MFMALNIPLLNFCVPWRVVRGVPWRGVLMFTGMFLFAGLSKL